MTDNNTGRPPLERRISFTQKLFGGARDWMAGSGKMESTSFSKTYENVPSESGIQDSYIHNTTRQRSKSLTFCERRDIIIPGPVF